MVNPNGDVIEEKDKCKEMPYQKKIFKSNMKWINENVLKTKETTNTETNEVVKDKELKNIKDEEIEGFEKKWSENTKEYKIFKED